MSCRPPVKRKREPRDQVQATGAADLPGGCGASLPTQTSYGKPVFLGKTQVEDCHGESFGARREGKCAILHTVTSTGEKDSRGPRCQTSTQAREPQPGKATNQDFVLFCFDSSYCQERHGSKVSRENPDVKRRNIFSIQRKGKQAGAKTQAVSSHRFPTFSNWPTYCACTIWLWDPTAAS